MSAPSQSMEESGVRILAFESSAKAASVAILQDGALRVDDYISVSVALDDGSIYSYDATRYSDDVPKLDWSCDEETARGSLPDNVSVIGSRKVIVQRPGGEYMACYEFDCTGSEGESLRIYADGSDGRQCRIQLEGV